jgi:4-hydroxy-tetrahydrodipicolinate reductase
MSREIKIGLCGLGSIGKAVGRLLIDYRSGFALVGAVTKASQDIGRPLGEVVGSSRTADIIVGGELDELLALAPDIIVYATGSFLKETSDDVIACVSAGVNVVSPCEELAFPFSRDADVSARIDAAAKSGGATVLGTGVNPGFIFDSFLVAASGCSWNVESITGRRVVDVAGFGQNIHRRLGIGYTPEEFEAGHQKGTIAGHVGFPESIELVAERLGLSLDGPVQEVFDPLVAQKPVGTTYGELPAGVTEGFVQRASGTVNGIEMIAFELVLHLRPVEAGMEASDTFTLNGAHPVSVTLRPGMDAIPATSAQLVNSIPGVLNAAAGLKTAKDLPSAGAWTSLERTMVR